MFTNSRIGIFPGTFDPLHEGHIRFALTALEQSHLDKVILLPEKTPRNKPTAANIDARVRYAETLLSDYPNIEIRTLKAETQTYKAEQDELGEIFDTARVVLLVGTDVLKTIPYWQDADLLLRDHELCVGIRGNESVSSVLEKIKQIELITGVRAEYKIIETKHKDISSTAIRSRKDYTPL